MVSAGLQQFLIFAAFLSVPARSRKFRAWLQANRSGITSLEAARCRPLPGLFRASWIFCALKPAGASSSRPATFRPKHARIVCQRLRLSYHDAVELWMPRVDEAVVLVRSKGGRHHEQTVFPPFYEFIADPGELRRRCGSSPIRRQMADFDLFAAQIVGHFGDC